MRTLIQKFKKNRRKAKHVKFLHLKIAELHGEIIAESFRAVGDHGVVMMESTDLSETNYELVSGVQYEKGLTNSHFTTSQDKMVAELDNPVVLLLESPVESIRSIQSILEYVIKNKKQLLVIGDLSQPVLSTLAMNKIKGNIKVNVINAPTFGISKKDMLSDLSVLTGAVVINEDLGDDLDTIHPDMLGTCIKSVTTEYDTVLQVDIDTEEIQELTNIVKKQLSEATSPGDITRLEKRLARLSGKVAIVQVGADSAIELKEKSDRVEDAICATKAAIKEGIVPGGGIALLNASVLTPNNIGEEVLFEAIKAPYRTILRNAHLDDKLVDDMLGFGWDVKNVKWVHMVTEGIIDPLSVTKSALKNAASVATTILSTDCVINNLRIGDESNR